MTASAHPPTPAERTSLRRAAVRSFAWAALSFGGTKLLVLVSTLVLARILAPREFGLVAACLAFVAYLEVMLDLGLASALVYRQEHGHSASVDVAFTLNAATCALLAGVNYAAASMVAGFFHAPTHPWIFRALSIYLLLRGLGAVQDGLLKRDLRFREKAVADLTRAVTRGGVGIGLALGGLRAWALIWGLIVAEACGVAVSWFYTRYRPRLAVDREVGAQLLRFGAPIVALSVLSELGGNGDYLVVGHALGPVALAVYTIAYRLPEMCLSNVYWIFSSVAFPVLCKARSTGADAFRASMLTMLRLITLFALPVGVGLALVSRDAIHVLFPADWAGAAVPMALVSLALAVSSLEYGSGDIFKAAGRPGTLLGINSVGTVVMFAGFVVAAPHGIVWVAAAHLCYAVGYAALRQVLANRLVQATGWDVLRALGPALLITCAIVVAALPVRLVVRPGPVGLVATVAAGVAGAVVGLGLFGRPVLAEVRGFLREVRASRSAGDVALSPEVV